MTTALVVDDSVVDRRLAGALVEKAIVGRVTYAASAVEALARMADIQPDLVITDLTMPIMDGLEFVKTLRAQHPDIPVILMTAYGSEALALEALEQGAASYVPKAQLAQRLPETIQEVLARADAERSSKSLLSCLKRCEVTLVLENDAQLIDPLVNQVQQMVAATQLCDFTGRLQVGIALKEALLNALFHGNLEIGKEQIREVEETLISEDQLSLVDQRRAQPPYCERRIFVDIEICEDHARFVVRDGGRGFRLPEVRLPEEPGTLEGGQGRGLVLMHTFMDEVHFNDAGNEVTMIRRRRPASEPARP